MSSLSLSPVHGLRPVRAPQLGRPALHLTRRGRVVGGLAAAALVASCGWVAIGGSAAAGSDVGAGTASPATAAPRPIVVTVEEGDSLWLIAQRVFPDRDPRDVVSDIRSANDLGSNLIHPGQVLAVPAAR